VMWTGTEPAFGVEPGRWSDGSCASADVLTVCEGATSPPTGCAPMADAGPGRWTCPEGLRWAEGASLCASTGGRLLRPRDEADNVAVLMQLSGAGFVWMGARDEASEGDWFWEAGDRVGALFTAFKIGEPNSYRGDEDCLESNLGAWNDNDCDAPAPYVCQGNNELPAGCDVVHQFAERSTVICGRALSYAEAAATCAQAGGHLARFSSHSDWMTVKQVLDGQRVLRAWIDGSDAQTEGLWIRSDGVVIVDLR
jgi:hypothetical protein